MTEIYVINLEERTDRWEQMKKLYPEFDLIRVDAVKHEKEAVGCFLSHKKCIQIAKEKGFQVIFIFLSLLTMHNQRLVIQQNGQLGSK